MSYELPIPTNLLLNNTGVAVGIAIAMEAKRLSEKYQKDMLECDDLIKITNLGVNNVRSMMNRKDFPLVQQGNRKEVSALGFILWTVKTVLKNELL